MRKAIKIVIVLLAVAFVVAQFIRPSFTNPPEVAGQTIEASANVPENVNAVLTRSCSDCHSNRTVYPWYSKISPVSWWLAKHIEDGRKELNISEWGTYSAKKQKHKLEEVCEMVNTGEMPLPSYLWAHFDAKLSEDEKKMLCDWAREEGAKIVVIPEGEQR